MKLLVRITSSDYKNWSDLFVSCKRGPSSLFPATFKIIISNWWNELNKRLYFTQAASLVIICSSVCQPYCNLLLFVSHAVICCSVCRPYCKSSLTTDDSLVNLNLMISGWFSVCMILPGQVTGVSRLKQSFCGKRSKCNHWNKAGLKFSTQFLPASRCVLYRMFTCTWTAELILSVEISESVFNCCFPFIIKQF